MTLTYAARAQHSRNTVAQKLFCLMDEKKTNLSLSADVTASQELLSLAHAVGPEICVLKTHVDILEDFSKKFLHELQRLAQQHHFILFEDRKFSDIGHTVKLQYAKGLYHIADWAEIVNAHILPGPGIIDGLKEIGAKKDRALLLLAQMSSKDNLFTPHYTQRCVEFALQHPEFIAGFISQEKLCDHPGFMYLTPGVNMREGQDTLGQHYQTPEWVIGEKHCDVMIVGRDIYTAKNPILTAQHYRQAGWEAYQKRLCLKSD